MIRANSGERVTLTFGTWLGVIGVLVSVIVVPLMVLQARLTTVENATEYNRQRIDRVESDMKGTRGEILAELKELRSDIKQIGK